MERYYNEINKRLSMFFKYCFPIFLIFISFSYITDIYSADEEPFHIYFNNEAYQEEQNLQFLSTVKVDIETANKETLDFLTIQVFKEGNEFSLEIDEDNKQLSFNLPSGHYDLLLHMKTNDIEIQKHIENIKIYDHLPIYVNDEILPEYFKTYEELTLYADHNTFIDMKQSFIMVNNEKQQWILEDEQYLYRIPEAGNYQIAFHFIDIYGNSIIQYHTILYEYPDRKLQAMIDTPYANIKQTSYYHDDIHIELLAAIVDISKVEVYIDELPQDVLWETKDNGYQASMTIVQEGIHTISCYYEKEKIATPFDEQIFILDKTPPVVTLDYPLQAIYANTLALEVVVKDDYFSFDSAVIEEFKEIEHHQNWQSEGTLYRQELKLQEDGVHKIVFDIADIAGNKATFLINGKTINDVESLSFLIDTTAPMIQDKTIYPSIATAQDVMLHLLLNDENLNDEATELVIQKDGIDYPQSISSLRTPTHELQIPLREDGTYCYTATAYDFAGNHYQRRCKETIVIDHTKPFIMLDNASHIQNTNQNVIIDIQVQDVNLKQYNLRIYRDGNLQEEVNGEDTVIKRMEFHEDTGTHSYKVEAWAVDEAGNETYANPLFFIIDKELPQIHAFLQGEPFYQKLLTNRSIQMKFTWQDAFIDRKELAIYKNGVLQDIQILNDEDSFQKFIKALQGHIDEYEYRLLVYDIAGNKSEAILSFMIDTYFPLLHIKNDIFQGKASNQTWVPQLEDVNKEIYIQDTILLRNQKEIYYEWGTPITEDGNYLLNVTARDDAGNMTSLKAPFHFVIDKTPPDIQAYDSEKTILLDDTYKGTPLKIKVDTGFLHQDVITSFIVNGNQCLLEPSETYLYELTEPGDYEIIISARDEAHNQSDKTYQFHIEEVKKTTNIPVYSLFLLLLSLVFFKIKICKS